VRLEIQRCERRKARSDEVIDEPLLVRLRLLVASALVEAEGWSGLQHGLAYRPKGGGLVLTDAETRAELCKGSDVGPAYLDLVRRFGAGFPGHPRPGLAAEALAGKRPAQGGGARPRHAGSPFDRSPD
jgi:ATP-dependent DNA helicase RecQ